MLSQRYALLLALSCAGAGCGNEDERLFADAARAERNDDYEGAARQLREIVIDHPDSPVAAQARFEFAEIQLLRTRDVTAVHGALVEILDDYPGTDVALEAHRLLARLYEHELQDPEKAIPHHLAVLEAGEGTDAARETLLSLAECYYRIEKLSEAAAAYQTAVQGSRDAPDFKPAAAPNLGEEAFAGSSQVGAEMHFGIGARDGSLIMSATHAGDIPVTPENSDSLIRLGGVELATAKQLLGR